MEVVKIGLDSWLSEVANVSLTNSVISIYLKEVEMRLLKRNLLVPVVSEIIRNLPDQFQGVLDDAKFFHLFQSGRLETALDSTIDNVLGN